MTGSEKRGKKPGQRVIGFVGCPPEDAIAPYRGEKLVDLDNLCPGVSSTPAEDLLPANTCSIIKRILANTLALRPEEVIYDDGYSKCDNARFLGEMIESLLPGVRLIRTQNDSRISRGTTISDSDLPLPEKVSLILDDIISPLDKSSLKTCSEPPAAFWGVPAADLSIYELFPSGTMILGWLRCFEDRTPSDIALECFVPENVPTVFFAQTFCSKNILAKHLAKKHNGLYVDSDGTLTRSERAKIEAFLHFRSEGH